MPLFQPQWWYRLALQRINENPKYYLDIAYNSGSSSNHFHNRSNSQQVSTGNAFIRCSRLMVTKRTWGTGFSTSTNRTSGLEETMIARTRDFLFPRMNNNPKLKWWESLPSSIYIMPGVPFCWMPLIIVWVKACINLADLDTPSMHRSKLSNKAYDMGGSGGKS